MLPLSTYIFCNEPLKYTSAASAPKMFPAATIGHRHIYQSVASLAIILYL